MSWWPCRSHSERGQHIELRAQGLPGVRSRRRGDTPAQVGNKVDCETLVSEKNVESPQTVNRKTLGLARCCLLGQQNGRQSLAAERGASNTGLAKLLASAEMATRQEQRAHKRPLLATKKVQSKWESGWLLGADLSQMPEQWNAEFTCVCGVTDG